MKRAQLFSADFVIAVSVLILAIGISVHSLDSMQRQAHSISGVTDRTAQSVAQHFVSSIQAGAFKYPPNYCYTFSNGTDTCQTLVCGSTKHTARRVVVCNPPGSPCLLEVFVCE